MKAMYFLALHSLKLPKSKFFFDKKPPKGFPQKWLWWKLSWKSLQNSSLTKVAGFGAKAKLIYRFWTLILMVTLQDSFFQIRIFTKLFQWLLVIFKFISKKGCWSLAYFKGRKFLCFSKFELSSNFSVNNL